MTLGDGWHFYIDAGGTFTDCIARNPEGRLSVSKVLSSGTVKARMERQGGRMVLAGIPALPDRFFDGYTCRNAFGEEWLYGDPDTAHREGPVELRANEPAPLLAIRMQLGARLNDPLGAVSVRLGTTRATNALLERKGARTAFLVTRGFGDLLAIGNQERPRLFDLAIKKPAPLEQFRIEASERIDADGDVLQILDEEALREDLRAVRDSGAESLAICFLHSYRNPVHEIAAEKIAREIGFVSVSRSSAISPSIKIVPRARTAVADAYVTPVIDGYLREIQRKIPEGKLRVITSAGGLVSPEMARGSELILSGPAGGVAGFAAVARAAGFSESIGFDMGGTSTDVSRFAGKFEREFETEKAGVQLSTPTLAIETVAAGGGSICAFDGAALTVGPASAGADPGPACYGRGGPLTVTDCNLLAGRVVADHFPFCLDAEAARRRLEEIAKALRESHQPMEPDAIVLGFLRIANGSMAAAIEKVTLEKGRDVRTHALVSFGGAGGQHACELAELLAVRTVLISPYSGVLSAYGMAAASIRKIAVKTVLRPYHDQDDFKTEFAELEQQVREEISAEGEPGEPEILQTLELRYQGQGSEISVPANANAAEEFERLHEQQHGYRFNGRPLEAVNLRVEAILQTPAFDPEEFSSSTLTPQAVSIRPVLFQSGRVDTPLYRREEFGPGSMVSGPALLTEPTSIVLIPPGWRGEILPAGDLKMTQQSQIKMSSDERTGTVPHPVDLRLMSRAYSAIAEQMGATLRRTSLSVNVKERLDFSCAIFSPAGELLVNAPHVPVHLGAMSETVKRILCDLPLAPGDAVVTNDPARGGSHLPDITVVTPVYTNSGELIFFTASRAHHAEIGGIRPGSMPPQSRTLSEEGVVIRPFKVIDGGSERFGALRQLLVSAPYPSRAPDENIADIGAQLAANRLGAEKLLALVDREGLRRAHAYMHHIMDAAERKTRGAIARLPQTVRLSSDQLDDGAVIRLRLTLNEGEANLDFSGTSPVQRGNCNANRAIVTAAALYCFRCLIGEDIPLNNGVLRPLSIELPDCFLNPPEHESPEDCAAVAAGNVETSQRIVDTILGALGVAAASQGTMNNLTFGGPGFSYYETICGGIGAGPGFHGASAIHSHMTNTRMTDPEIFEARYPVRLLRFSIRPGSGGAGRWKGGDGVRREIQFRDNVELSMICNRRTTAPYGCQGGESGAPGRNRFRRLDGSEEDLPASFERIFEPGETLIIETPGGGGWGAS